MEALFFFHRNLPSNAISFRNRISLSRSTGFFQRIYVNVIDCINLFCLRSVYLQCKYEELNTLLQIQFFVKKKALQNKQIILKE